MSATSSPIAYAASDATQVPAILNDVNADAFDLDRALDSILSEEVPLSGDASDFNDTEMDEASVAMATPSLADNCTPVQGIEKNVAILKGRIYELSTMIIQHGQVVPSSLITELRSLRSSLEELIEVQRLMTPVITPTTTPPMYKPTPRAIVPTQLPFFQWSGHVYDTTRTVFNNLKSCISKFEDVLNTYQLDLNEHWQRLLPLCLPTEIRAWLSDFTTEFPCAAWEVFKTAINGQYGITVDAEQESATTDLLNLRMSQHQSIESFIDKFQDLKRRAGLTSASVLCPRFVSALPLELSDQVTVALATAPSTTKRNLSFIMALAKELYNKLYSRSRRNNHSSTSSASPSPASPSRIEKRYSGGRQRHSSNNSRSFTRDSNAPAASGSNQQYCTYHKSYGNHSTDSCRALKNANSNFASTGTNNSSFSKRKNPCFRCGVENWSPSHICPKGKGQSSSSSVRFYGKPADPAPAVDELTQRAMNLQPVNNNNQAQRSSPSASLQALTFVDDDEDTDMLEDISQQCKSTTKNQTINPEPTLIKNSHSILVPITIQNYQTWAYLDTGSNFSAIKPSLVKTLGLTPVCPNNNSTSSISSSSPSSPINNKNNIISLGHKNNTVPRIGFIEKIKVFYNNITVHHKFEVFDLHSEADICIGLDLMPRLNIAVTGLITTWNDSTLPTIEDPIDPSPNTPSFEYFGTENIRNQFMNSIKRELDDNANIDPTSVCTIPNSEFKLAVSDNTVINKKQYPLALAYKPQLDAQLDTWLADKTIVVAEPHNPHNNPILFVKKRDDNGNYGNIVRVATDCRELNLSLIPSKSDNFALPRIEEIHEQLSHCQLFTVLDLKSCFTRFAIAKDSQPYTAFTTHRGQFQFAKACFGISTLPSFVQRMISNLFRDMPTVFCYIDDITIGSRTNNIHEHKKLVKDVITRLNNAGLILQRKKCHFLLISLTLLGFKLSSKGLQIDSSKICNLDKLPPIINNKALMRVLGFFGYFRKFINNYSKISAPLDRLRNISDNALFRKTWNETHDKAYAGLKYAVTHAPVISVMDTSLPLRVSTDASGYAIGGYVWQIDRTNTIRFLGFASRSLTKSEKKLLY